MLQKIFKPYKSNKQNLLRIGPKSDGGYIIDKRVIKKTSVIISCGLNDDWKFEKYFLKLNPSCKIIAYDHTINEKFWKDRFKKDTPHWHISEQFFTGYYCKKLNINATSLYKMVSQWVDSEDNFYFENKLHSGNNFVCKNGFIPPDVFPMTHASSHWLNTPQLQSWVNLNLKEFGYESIIKKT